MTSAVSGGDRASHEEYRRDRVNALRAARQKEIRRSHWKVAGGVFALAGIVVVPWVLIGMVISHFVLKCW